MGEKAVRESMGSKTKEEEKTKATNAKNMKAVEAKQRKLPDEMELDILLRLPVRSLLRFKAVCRPWRSLINDPSFVKEHLNRTNQGNNLNLWRLCYIPESRPSLRPDSRDVGLYSRGIEASDRNKPGHFFQMSPHVLQADILASCNGLLLIGFNDLTELCLFNPSTGEYNNFSGQYYSRDGINLWGIGHDSSGDDYKVIRVVRILSPAGSPAPGDEPYDGTHIEFFDFKTNSWTEIDDFPYDVSCWYGGQGTVVRGAPHWMMSRRFINYFPKIRVIVCFDSKEEKFKEIPSPIWLDESLKFDLGILGGCLCMSHNRQGISFEVWTMKEYGVQDSWTKLFVITHWFEYLKPLCFEKNGEVLMEVDRNRFVIYNLKENTCTTILSWEDLRSQLWFKVGTYVESLVSPHIKSGTWKRTNRG